MPYRRSVFGLMLALANTVACAQTLSARPNPVYANAPATLTLRGLPPSATGSVMFADNATALATLNITGAVTANYQAFGDSIPLSPSYADLLAAKYSLALTNAAIPHSIACDILPTQILTNNLGPNAQSSPLTSLMTGSVDAANNTPDYDPVFSDCHQAAIAWLAIPREAKVLAGDPAISLISSTWVADATTFNTLITTASGSSVRYTITTAGSPIYLWHLLSDFLSGTFTLAIDNIPATTVYATQPTPAIASANTPQLKTFGLIRIPVLPGVHTVDVTAISGTVGILAVATAGNSHPTVLVPDVPNQLPGNTAAVSQYTTDVHADATLLAADGLDIRYIPTHSIMLGTPAEMLDAINPNSLGQAHLAAAFSAALGSFDTAPYTAFANTPPTTTATFANPGLHALTSTYGGDTENPASTATASLTVLAQQATLTSLTTPATHAYAGSPAAFTASVSPSSTTGTVSFYDGTQLLTQLPLTSGSAIFSTSTLAVGVHTLSASYSGDFADTASASPSLAIQILPTPTTLTLAPIPATTTYGPAINLTATILPATATGTVTFYDKSQLIGTGTLANGVATFSPVLTIGTHALAATYSGDTNDLGANTAAVLITITPIPTTITLSPPAASVAYGSTISLNALVSPATATGDVTFQDTASGSLAQTALIHGNATITAGPLAVGAHTFTALYSGDTTHTTSTSSTVSTQVITTPTSTALDAIAASLSAGSSLTLSAYLTPSSATGTILFRDAIMGTLGEITISNGAASLQLSSLATGRYSITAVYSGDVNDAPSTSAAVTTQVAPTQTLTALTQPATALYSAPISVTATVTPAIATGLVQFSDTTGILASALLRNGTASTQLPTLPTGPHALRAVYPGDSINGPSTSPAGNIVITPDPTTTTLTLAQTSVPAGGLVTVNIRVATGLAANPTGTVSVLSGASVLATGALANASNGAAYATLSFPATTLGLSSVTASYAGDSNDLASTCTPVAYTVVPTPTTATLTLSAPSVPPQSTVTLSVTVASTSQIPTGSVALASNGQPLATVPLNAAGQASTTLTAPAIGAYTITATYVPTGLFAAAAAPAETLIVTPPLALMLTPTTLSATPGSTYTATLAITPLSGFSGAIKVTCESPSYITCSLNAPASLNAPIDVGIQLVIPKSTAAASIFPLLGLMLLPLCFPRRRHRNLLLLLLSILVLGTSSCGNGGSFFSIPDGANTVVINATAAGTTVSTSFTVNITH